MQVPEKLSLIGGSILLASTLMFTLKSQASHILPKIAQPIHDIQDKTSDTQNGNDFSDGLKQAQQNHWQTGQWGSAKYYIDNQQNMYVGGGELQGRLKDIPNASTIHTLNFDRPVTAPVDSSYLLTPTDWNDNFNLNHINGAEKIDTSHATNMYRIFGADDALQSVNVSTWDVSHVKNLSAIFVSNKSISNIEGLNDWDIQSANNTLYSFYNTPSLHDLDLSNWKSTSGLSDVDNMFSDNPKIQSININNLDTSKANSSNMFGADISWDPDSNLSQLTLGPQTKLNIVHGLTGNWKNNTSGQIISAQQLINSGQAHPGTWVKQ